MVPSNQVHPYRSEGQLRYQIFFKCFIQCLLNINI
nr:MAG TPA: hypothetical protein [Ackermannviridae sp.]